MSNCARSLSGSTASRTRRGRRTAKGQSCRRLALLRLLLPTMGEFNVAAYEGHLQWWIDFTKDNVEIGIEISDELVSSLEGSGDWFDYMSPDPEYDLEVKTQDQKLNAQRKADAKQQREWLDRNSGGT